MKHLLFVACGLSLVACDQIGQSGDSMRSPRAIAPLEARAIAQRALRSNEQGMTIRSVTTYPAPGLGQTATQVVIDDGESSTAFVVDEDGVRIPTEVFWRREQAALLARFGKLTPELAAIQAAAPADELVDVEIQAAIDVPQPELPYDGTDQKVSTEEFERWSSTHAKAQAVRIRSQKAELRAFLQSNRIQVSSDPDGLPTIVARVPAGLLTSPFLNGPRVARIEKHQPSEPHLQGDHAGHYAMNAQQLTGGVCGALPCDGLGFTVGLWEGDFGAQNLQKVGGIARQNGRFGYGSSTTAVQYEKAPTSCTTDADCAIPFDRFAPITNAHFCRPVTPGNPQMICVQEHLSYVAASLGMTGTYDFSATLARNVDPSPNVPPMATLNATGAFNLKLRIANDTALAIATQLDYLVQPTGGAPPATYINRSSDPSYPAALNWAARAYGAFVTISAGNSGNAAQVQCGSFKNGLCVGMFSYQTYNDLLSHSITAESSAINPAIDPTLERPHLLGPGTHHGGSGEHFPDIQVSSGNGMVNSSYLNHPPTLGQIFEIKGTSFSAPAVLSAALQAHLYEGAFSYLAYPMVNKAVLLASTQDANNDGPVGKSRVWSAQPSDAVDGAGQLNLARTKTILDNNQYYFGNLNDANFTSCGTNCRQLVVATPTVPAGVRIRAALAWQTCMTSAAGPGSLNDLDLVVTRQGTIFEACEKSSTSNTVTSETEMLEMGPCPLNKTYTIAVRVKNGATLTSCSASDATERIGVAWSLRPTGMP